MRWIIGDIHGMSVALRGLIAAVRQVDSKPSWLFVGDYVNRGPDSRGVIDMLLRLPNAKFTRGNHDDIFDLILSGQSSADMITHNNRGAAFQWFMQHGLGETLASYGAAPALISAAMDQPTSELLDELTAKVPQSHREFLRNLPPVLEEPDLFVVHAKWEIDTPDEDPSPTTFLDVDPELRKTAAWGRFTLAEIDGTKSWNRTGYFGHTPVDTYGARGGYDPKGGGKLVPIVGDRIVLVDTAAALSPAGRLTAYSPDKHAYLQVDRNGVPVE